MLQWTTAGAGPRLGVIVHHTDAEREYAYDRDSMVGRLDRALDAGAVAGWTVVSMTPMNFRSLRIASWKKRPTSRVQMYRS